MNLNNPSKDDLVVGKFFLSLKMALEGKHQLLPYLRTQIIEDTEKHFIQLTDEAVKNYIRTLK